MKFVTSNSFTALAVFCIWSMELSIDVIRSRMLPRSNGVMKRAAHRDQDLARDVVGVVLAIHHDLVVRGDRIAALQHRPQRLGAGHHRVRMLIEQVEELSSLGIKA